MEGRWGKCDGLVNRLMGDLSGCGRREPQESPSSSAAHPGCGQMLRKGKCGGRGEISPKAFDSCTKKKNSV